MTPGRYQSGETDVTDGEKQVIRLVGDIESNETFDNISLTKDQL